MTKKLTREVTKLYIAGTPSIAPSPARCYTVTRSTDRQGSVGGSGAEYIFVPLPEAGTSTSHEGFLTPVFKQVEAYYDDSGNLVTQELIGYRALRFSPDPTEQPAYTTTTETICTEAVEGVEGTPAQTINQNAGPDWRASARSVRGVTGGAAVSFNVNTSPRMLVGFSTQDTGANQNDIRMGVAFVTAGASTQVFPVLDGVVQGQVATYVTGDRVTLSRISGRFYIQLAGDVVYNGAATTEDEVFLDAMLYTSADFVDDPVLASATSTVAYGSLGFSAGLGTAVSVTGEVGFGLDAGALVDGVAAAKITGTVGFTATSGSTATQRVAIDGTVGFTEMLRTGVFVADEGVLLGAGNTDLSGATVNLGPLEITGSDKPYTAVRTTLSPLAVEAAGGQLNQSVAGGDLVLAPLQAGGNMLSGGLIDASLTLQPLKALGVDRATYGEGRVTLRSLATYGDDGFGVPDYYGHNDSLQMASSMYTDPSLFASVYETLELGTEMSLGVVMSGATFDGLILDPSLSAKDFLSALIDSGISLASATRVPSPEVLQYAFNAASAAPTRYSEFDFAGYARTGGVTYAVKPDGLYRLRPGDDDGQLRSALVDFGAMAFGVSNAKHIDTLFLGLDTDGTVYAKLQGDNDTENVYRVIQRPQTMRVETGRGVTAREWRLKLEFVDSSVVDLTQVEFVIAASSRRWSR